MGEGTRRHPSLTGGPAPRGRSSCGPTWLQMGAFPLRTQSDFLPAPQAPPSPPTARTTMTLRPCQELNQPHPPDPPQACRPPHHPPRGAAHGADAEGGASVGGDGNEVMVMFPQFCACAENHQPVCFQRRIITQFLTLKMNAVDFLKIQAFLSHALASSPPCQALPGPSSS